MHIDHKAGDKAFIDFAGKKLSITIQTIKDNVSLLTPEVLDKINQVVVKAGHNLVKKRRKIKRTL